jgi:uncharacterized protein YbjT (DUF2867 family)
MQTTSSPTTLVLGGTGKTGRRVAERLAARGLPVRIGSRAGTPPFDWDDDATWDAALAGVGRVYITYQPDLAIPGAAATVGAFARRAVAHGAERLVLLSGRGEEGARRGEEAVRAAGAETTVVRASWFAQNFSEDYLADAVRDGVIALPAGDVPEPFVDADDIADVAVAALTEDGHDGEVYEVTGPRLLSFADVAAELSAATGRTIRYVPVSAEEFRAGAVEQGVPGEVVELLTFLFGEVLDGRNASLTDGVRRALGRPPRDFRDYARAAAATGVWNAPANAGRA